MKMRFELSIEIDDIAIDTLIKEEHVDSIDELSILYKSDIRKDPLEFLSQWSAPIKCLNFNIEK